MDELELLRHTSQGYAPLVSGAPPPRLTGMEGVPLLGGGGGPFQAVAGMALTPYYQRMLGSVGMVPMGVGHDRNVADTLRHMQFTQMQQEAMKKAADADRTTFMQTMQGMAALTGTPFGAQQHQAASTLVNGAVMAAPIMASVMPDFYDALGGMRGSAAVLASRSFDAGRFRIDPITGRMGVSAETAGFTAQRLMNDLYADENIAQMQGITGGQLGNMFKQLQHRGMVAGASSEEGYGEFRPGSPYGEARRALDSMRDNYDPRLSRAASVADVDISKGLDSLSGADLDKMMATPDVGDYMRGFDADRVKRSLKGYTDAIVAMKDIFGDNGQPNAPMAQLVQGLEALTAGSMHQIDPSRLNMIVRDIHNLSRNTGVSMNGVMMMQNHAANRAAELGIEPIFAAEATNYGLAWTGAYRAGGHSAHQAWGAKTADQYAQMTVNRRVNAAGSEMMNRLGALRRVSGLMHGFEAGSEIAAIDTALAGGRSTYEFGGEKKDVRLSELDLVKLVTEAKGKHGTPSGMSERDVRELLAQRSQNREQGDKDRLVDPVMATQGAEVRDNVLNPMTRVMLNNDYVEQLMSNGMSKEAASKRALELSKSSSASIVDRIQKLSTSQFSGSDRNLHVSGIIADEMIKSGAAKELGLAGEDLHRFTHLAADKWYGNATQALQDTPYGLQHAQDWHRQYNPTTDQDTTQFQWHNRLESIRQTALSPLGRGTPMRRAFEAIRNLHVDDEQALARTLSATFGGVDSQALTDALRKPMTDAAKSEKVIEEKLQAIEKIKDPEKRAEAEEEVRRLQVEFRGQMEHIGGIGAKYGHFSASGVTKDETLRALRVNHDLVQTQKALEGLMMEPDDKKRREGYDKVWSSDQGRTIRRTADHFVQDMGNIGYRLVATPEMVYRFGDKGVEMSKQLTQGQDRLNQLAMLYAGGDMSRLLSGDIKLEAGKEHDEVLREAGDIRKAAQDVMAAVHDQHGKESPTITEDEQKRLQKIQSDAYDALTEPGEASLRKIYGKFGLQLNDTLTPEQFRIASKLEGGVGRSFARLAQQSQDTLKKIAEESGKGVDNEGITNLGYDYEAAMAKAEKGDNSALEQMRNELKGGTWLEFEKAMQFQVKSGLIHLNRGETGPTMDNEFENMLEKMRSGKYDDQAPHDATGPGYSGPLVITGNLTLKGDGTMDINATSGSARGYTAGVC